MTKEKIQATGSYDGTTEEYSLSISSGALVVILTAQMWDDSSP